jgi:hypothetical protein
VAYRRKPACERPRTSAEEDCATWRQRHVGSLERFGEGGFEGLVDSHNLARGLHLGAEVGINAYQFGHREDGGFNGHKILIRPEAGLTTERPERFAQHHLDGEPDHGDAGDLGQEGDRAAGTRIDLEDVDLRAFTVGCPAIGTHDHVLNVHQSLYAQGHSHAPRVVNDRIDLVGSEAERRVYGH